MAIRDERADMVDGGEPIYSQEAKVIQVGRSLYVTVTEFGGDTHDIEKGDTVTVHTHGDGIVIEPDTEE